MNRLLLSATTIALGLALTCSVQAQHGHGGGHGHGGHGHGHGGHGHGGHGYGGGHYYGHGHYYGNGYYPSVGFGVYAGYPYYGGYYSYPRYVYVSPSYASPDYYGGSYAGAASGVAADRCTIEVRLPDPDAELLIDGQKTSSVGRVRRFASPSLDSGRSYTYTITATWRDGDKPVKDVRKVSVAAGRLAAVDFGRPSATEQIPAPRGPESSP